MKLRLPPTSFNATIPSLMLVAVYLAACAPAATPTQPAPESVVFQPTATFLPAVPALDQTHPSTPGLDPAPTPFPIATSRGDALEASDPATVSLATGQYQVVEFFRFT